MKQRVPGHVSVPAFPRTRPPGYSAAGTQALMSGPVHSTGGGDEKMAHDKSGSRPLRFYVLFGYYGLTRQFSVETRSQR